MDTSLSLNEMCADDDEMSFNQKCKFGNLLEGHAVYCHCDNPNSPFKCRRSWYTGGEVRDEDCEFYQPNPKLVKSTNKQ